MKPSPIIVVNQSVACSGSTSTVASYSLLLFVKLVDVMSQLQSIVSVSAQTVTTIAHSFHICIKPPSVDTLGGAAVERMIWRDRKGFIGLLCVTVKWCLDPVEPCRVGCCLVLTSFFLSLIKGFLHSCNAVP